MWSIFQLQDLLGMDEGLRREDPDEERINVPADPTTIGDTGCTCRWKN